MKTVNKLENNISLYNTEICRKTSRQSARKLKVIVLVT